MSETSAVDRSTNVVDILLVEDNPNDAELMIRALKKHNFANNMLHFKDGTEILDYLFKDGGFSARKRSEYPKIILLDLKLPKVDGIEVLRRVKSDDLTKEIPVIVLTSSQESRDLKACYSLGVNSYVAKPIKFDEFVQAVGQIGLYWLLLNKPPKE